MYWGFYLLPCQPPSILTTPNIILQKPPSTQQPQAQPKLKIQEKSPEYTGIQINLTPAQLLEAGYQTNKKPWNEEEDTLLMNLFKKGDLSWKQIADKMPGRTSKMCYSRYRRIENQTKKLWNQDEEIKIREAVQVWGFDWLRISEIFPKRTPKQIQDHYNNYLRPGINKDPWTYEQDLMLMQLLRKFGKNWELIEGKLPGRTHNQIKNRYYGRLKRMEDKKQESENREKRLEK